MTQNELAAKEVERAFSPFNIYLKAILVFIRWILRAAQGRLFLGWNSMQLPKRDRQFPRGIGGSQHCAYR